MDIKRLTVALALAVALASGATFLLYRGIHNQRSAQPQFRKIVAAARSIDSGSVLSAANLVLLDWPADLVVPGSFSTMDEIAGRSLIYPVSEKQPILPAYLATPGSGIGLTVKIPEGMRATSVRSNEVTGVAGFLFPGSHVDVLVSFKAANGKEQQTQTVLQNVEVLTVGQHIEPDPNGKPETVSVITFLLTPQDSEKIVLASQEGTVQFVLRNGADNTKATTVPVGISDLVYGEQPKTRLPVIRPKLVSVVAKVKPVNFYEVETIQGEKRATDKFKVPE
ncbi:MAG TPA: Flp pilus assembly protein CpaB [Candidatus Angelobacter sp.]|nr:Flp pilus assembly protein CpaB [Candidatus Angelobacter sp.]